MSIQSLFDQRNFYQKLSMLFSNDNDMKFSRVFTSSHINHMLKDFHLSTAKFNPNAHELEAPAQSGGFRNHHGEAKEFIRPEISEVDKLLFRRHMSEAWYD